MCVFLVLFICFLFACLFSKEGVELEQWGHRENLRDEGEETMIRKAAFDTSTSLSLVFVETKQKSWNSGLGV